MDLVLDRYCLKRNASWIFETICSTRKRPAFYF